MITQDPPLALEGPRTFTEAVERADGERWMEATTDEILSSEKKYVRTLANLLLWPKPIATKWVYQLKKKSDGSVDL